jgi:hypothetical protein
VVFGEKSPKIAYGFLRAAKPNMELEHSHTALWQELESKYDPFEAMDEAA